MSGTTEQLAKKMLADSLKAAGRLVTMAPDFDKRETLADWGGELWSFCAGNPVAHERILSVLQSAHTRWDRWPSFRELLGAAGIEVPSPDSEIQKAVRSIWAHLDKGSDLTLLGGRIFDRCGGWEVVGQQAMGADGRKHWDHRFWQMGKHILEQDENKTRLPPPALPPASPEDLGDDDVQRAIADPAAYLAAKSIETHEIEVRPRLECDLPYEERKRRALEEGKDYWEPPRSWELDGRELTPHERRLWARKIGKELEVARRMVSVPRSM